MGHALPFTGTAPLHPPRVHGEQPCGQNWCDTSFIWPQPEHGTVADAALPNHEGGGPLALARGDAPPNPPLSGPPSGATDGPP